MAFLIGASLGIYLISLAIKLIFFRKAEGIFKELLPVLIAYPIVVIAYAYGAADGGDIKFLEGAEIYGIATVIVMIVVLFAYSIRKKFNRSESE